jgi:hypothetical protein
MCACVLGAIEGMAKVVRLVSRGECVVGRNTYRHGCCKEASFFVLIINLLLVSADPSNPRFAYGEFLLPNLLHHLHHYRRHCDHHDRLPSNGE